MEVHDLVADGLNKVAIVRWGVGNPPVVVWTGRASVMEYVLLYMNWIETLAKMLCEMTKPEKKNLLKYLIIFKLQR